MNLWGLGFLLSLLCFFFIAYQGFRVSTVNRLFMHPKENKCQIHKDKILILVIYEEQTLCQRSNGIYYINERKN